MVQLASILAWGASGRPFESGHSDSKKAVDDSTAFFVLVGIASQEIFPKSIPDQSSKSIENQKCRTFLPKNTINKLIF